MGDDYQLLAVERSQNVKKNFFSLSIQRGFHLLEEKLTSKFYSNR